MKKSVTGRIIAVLLAFVMMLAPVLSASAAAAESYNKSCPYIFIHGYMGSDIYVDPDDPDSETAWPPSSSAITAAIKKALPYLAKFLITHNWDDFADDVLPIVYDMFSPCILAPDGTVQDKSGVRFTYPEASSIKKDSQLKFVYDWRLDPLETAAKLNDYINYVLECSGSDKVVIECHSYGGVIFTTYAKLYGDSKIKSVMYNSTAVYGETFTGELFLGEMNFDADALVSFLQMSFDNSSKEYMMDSLFKSLYDTGIMSLVCKFANYAVEKMTMKKISGCIMPMFAGWLSTWAMVPDDMIDDAYDYVFNTAYAGDTTDRSGLQAKIKAYNTQIRPYKTETLDMLNADCNFYVISRYGYCSNFLTPSWRNASDGVIDVKFTSFGATAAQYGSQLSDDYINKADLKYISPDYTIDASTCRYPEQTWFLTGLTHGNNEDGLTEFIKTLLYYEGQATVDTFENYPRFIHYDQDTDSIIPDGLLYANEPEGIDKAVAIVKEVFGK